MLPRVNKPRPLYADPGTVVELPLGSDDRIFIAEVWGDVEGPVVYLMHGWGGYRGQLGAFVAPLVAAGYRVVAFDAPSHGESAPGSFGAGRSLITEFLAALAAVTREFGAAHGVVAHSLGGGATAMAVLDGLPAHRLVLIAPAPDPNTFARMFAATLGFGDRVRADLIRRLERRVGRPMSDFDTVTRAREAAEARLGGARGPSSNVTPGAEAAAPPLLVIHDQEDKEIPYAQGKAIAEAWRGAELLSTRGLGHRRILRDPEVIRTAVEFLGLPHPAGTVSAPQRASQRTAH
jgi:pimeloyl-ACP methyl ester carboxylesterase